MNKNTCKWLNIDTETDIMAYFDTKHTRDKYIINKK